MAEVDVVIEVGSKKVFASALDWPGWARSGKTEQDAIEALVAYAPRYAEVADLAKKRFVATVEPKVVEHVTGDGGTDFGVPHKTAKAELEGWTKRQAEKPLALMQAAWKLFDTIAKKAPEELTKGPRGGGRDTSKIVDHVTEAENSYARMLGLKVRVEEQRKAIVEVLDTALSGEPLKDKGWTPRYAVRRITWHVLDHAWEIQDRTP